MTVLPDTSGGEARRWFAQAHEELVAARHIADDSELSDRIACFHTHLAAEKALKALLIAFDTPFPKTHDLTELKEFAPLRCR